MGFSLVVQFLLFLGSQEKKHNQQATDEEKRVHRESGVADQLISEAAFCDKTEELEWNQMLS